jgi:hypothetical protein
MARISVKVFVLIAVAIFFMIPEFKVKLILMKTFSGIFNSFSQATDRSLNLEGEDKLNVNDFRKESLEYQLDSEHHNHIKNLYTLEDLADLESKKNTKFIFVSGDKNVNLNRHSLVKYIRNKYTDVLCAKYSRTFYSFLNIFSRFERTNDLDFSLIDDRSTMLTYSMLKGFAGEQCMALDSQHHNIHFYFTHLSHLYPRAKFIYFYKGDDAPKNGICENLDLATKCLFIQSKKVPSNLDEFLNR